MLNPQQERYANRLRDLIEEGKAVVVLERPSSIGRYIQGEDKIPLQAWLMKVGNIVESVFGVNSPHVRHLKELLPNGVRPIQRSRDVLPVIGLLYGALDDLEKGYLIGQEFLIAGEVLDSVLVQARYLLEAGYKDPAAILGRVVIENTLKRLARNSGIDNAQKACAINNELKKAGKYAQPQWRLIQVWLDIGNAAAHGKLNDYNKDDVEQLLDGIEGFVAGMFHA